MNRILIVAEHAGGALKLGVGSAVAFAREVLQAEGGEIELLVLGADLEPIAEEASRCGAACVLIADAPALRHPRADAWAHVIAQVARERGATLVAAAWSTFSKDILPRAAALLDAAMVSDVIGVRGAGGDLVFRRAMFAGNVVATVRLAGPVRVATIRPGAFAAAPPAAVRSPIVRVVVDEKALPSATEFVGREEKGGGRPDPTEARVVVSGGRALRTAEDFERLVGGLADALGGAVGSSRALVDAGIAPNALQIGQTGKIVAPDLYVAVGISGAIQHVAGMKDAKLIVAINKDAAAPIFEVADLGLVADVYTAVPELIAKLEAP